MYVLLLLLFASHISASTVQASLDENSNATSDATDSSSTDFKPQAEPVHCWSTDLNQSFCSSVEACHLLIPDCENSCHKVSSVLLHNLIILYAPKEDVPVFADGFRHDPFVSDDGGSCGELARETFKTLTFDDREFPAWLLGLLVGIACTLLGVSIGVGSCCVYIKRRKKALDKEDPRTGNSTDLRVQTIDVTAPTASDIRLHKARSSPRQALAKSPALPVAKKPKGNSIVPETPTATRTALPGIDVDDRERDKKPKRKPSPPKTPISPIDKLSAQPPTDVDDPEIKASAPSPRSAHRSGYGSG